MVWSIWPAPRSPTQGATPRPRLFPGPIDYHHFSRGLKLGVYSHLTPGFREWHDMQTARLIASMNGEAYLIAYEDAAVEFTQSHFENPNYLTAYNEACEAF